jgi:hypothetical protein
MAHVRGSCNRESKSNKREREREREREGEGERGREEKGIGCMRERINKKRTR